MSSICFFVYLILRHKSTLSYLNGNKDFDHIFDALADCYHHDRGVQPPEVLVSICSEILFTTVELHHVLYVLYFVAKFISIFLDNL